MCSSSRDTITAGDDFVRIKQVCFHALQTSEKAIKALLLCRGIRSARAKEFDCERIFAESAVPGRKRCSNRPPNSQDKYCEQKWKSDEDQTKHTAYNAVNSIRN